jgi:hypothetical protein
MWNKVSYMLKMEMLDMLKLTLLREKWMQYAGQRV